MCGFVFCGFVRTKRNQKRCKREPNAVKKEPKRSKNEPKGSQRAPKVSQKAIIMHPRIALSARVDFGSEQGGTTQSFWEALLDNF